MSDRFFMHPPEMGKGRMCATTQVKALKRVEAERKRQDLRWGTRFPDRSLFEWLTILTEEVGELAEAILDADRLPPWEHNKLLAALQHVADETTQVAAVAVSMLEWMASIPEPE